MSLHIDCGYQVETLVRQLAGRLNPRTEGSSDPFVAPLVLVRNSMMARWLRLELARRNGIAIQIEVNYLEKGLWSLLRRLAPESLARATLLNQQILQSMLLALLSTKAVDEPEISLVRQYLQGEAVDPHGRDFARRAWQLSDRLARSFFGYEIRRSEMLDRWRRQDLYFKDLPVPEKLKRMEVCQRSLYRRLFHAGGLVDRLQNEHGRRYLTLKQMAEAVFAQPLEPESVKSVPVHVFCPARMAPEQTRMLHQLGKFFPIDLYLLNFSSELWKDSQSPATERWHRLGNMKPVLEDNGDERLPPAEGENDLLRLWGQPGRELLKMFSDLDQTSTETSPLQVTLLEESGGSSEPGTLLEALQKRTLHQAHASHRKRQDRSLQLAACPGVSREVETVYTSILQNLASDSSLKQTEIAVLVPDLVQYKPVLESIFDRAPQRLAWNLSDPQAGTDSLFAAGLLSLMALADSPLTRADVFSLLANPCFQQAQGLTRSDLAVWLRWIDQLGVFRGFDKEDKYRDAPDTPDDRRNPLYTWQQGLRRLRLGRIMEVGSEPSDCARHFHELVPYSDFESQDAEPLGRFSRTIESLVFRLRPMAARRQSCRQWKDTLVELMDTFLAIPEDRPEEARVRETLLRRLDEFVLLDNLLQVLGEPPEVPLALFQEFLQSNVEQIGGSRGLPLTGGVTVASLKTAPPIPFKIIYILGLGEGRFPEGADPTPLDLRQASRRLGDVSRPEEGRYLFLEALFSARSRLYLSYVSRHLQKDQVFYPCSVLNELTRYLDEEVLAGQDSFKPVEIPLKASSAAFLEEDNERKNRTDLLEHTEPFNRLMQLIDLAPAYPSLLNEAQAEEIERQKQSRSLVHPPEEPVKKVPPDVECVRLRELKDFLYDPLDASIRRHLRLFEEDEEDLAEVEDEPFFSASRWERQVLRKSFEQALLARPERQEAKSSSAEQFFDAFYDDAALRSQAPEGAFAEIDREAIRQTLLALQDPLDQFLQERAKDEFTPGVVLGEVSLATGEDRRFPPLEFEGEISPPGDERLVQRVELHGRLPLVWKDTSENAGHVLVLAPVSKAPSAKDVSGALFFPFLFYAAMRAGTRGFADGLSSSAWIGEGPFHIHVLCRDRLLCRSYQLTPDEARDYLRNLTTDFLAEGSFDHLPFSVIGRSDVYARHENERIYPYRIDEDVADTVKGDYRISIEEALEDEGPWAGYRPGDLIRIIDTSGCIPLDAFDIVRRRFRPIYRFLAPAKSSGKRRSR